MARADETLDLAARHLDPSLVDVLRILGFDKEYVSARRAPSSTTPTVAPTSTSTPARGSRASATAIPTCARSLAADARRRPRRWRADPLLGARRDARRGAVGAPAARARRRVLREHRRRGGRLGDEVRSRGDRPAAADVLRQQLPRRHARAALARRRRVLQGGLRPAAARAARAFPSATSRAWRRELRARDVAAFIVEPIQGRMVTLPPRRLSAGRAGAVPALRDAVRRSTRCRPDSDARARGSRSSTGRSSPTSCSSARRSAGATCRSRRWSPAARSTSRPWVRSSARYVHQSTFGRNRLSMAAGLATLRIIERDRLVEHAAHIGALLLDGLAELQQRYEMIERGPRQRADDRDRAAAPQRPRRAAQLAA